MAESLRRLAQTSSFSVLQDKLESWHRDYRTISCDQNLNRCCELIELTAKLQGQLFAILNLTAAEGGQYAGVDTLKTRLLPWLGSSFSTVRPSVSADTSLQLLQDSAEKDRKIRELSLSHESDMQKMETRLSSTRLQLESVRAQLLDVQKELEETKSRSATTLLATEEEILQLKADLQSAQEQVEVYKRRLHVPDDYERQIRLLREELLHLNAEKAVLQDRLVRSPSPLPQLSRPSSPLRGESPTRAQLTESSRRAALVSRFSRLYAAERLEAQNLLRHYVTDVEMVQKIIFIAVVESFRSAKLAYRQFKLRVKTSLSSSHFGPESLEDAAVDYIVRNLDLYDVHTNDVINAMNVNPQISFPPEVDFSLISVLIRETCRLAFAMQTLDPPLDLAFASDGELYNDTKYCRSFDSDFTAPLVTFHVWPALMEGNTVIVKGEAVTRRAAMWSSSRRSTSPGRSPSLSPTRSPGINSRRSLSPERLRTSHL
ncbi:mitochondria-eating protein [Oryzias melastigma]|uniref:Mitochondria-eating protein n=1 Tax=Oryzias melastigma TaxID=30732 RepID=A0A3B3DNL5_ORYME|nr:mitochondria-eating protein [Oryzias melastigma]